MKGVIWSRLPQARILDLSHGVRAHNVLQAGFFLSASWSFLPQPSICLAVIDPGVGSGRGILVCRHKKRWLVLPDNGLLSQLLDQEGDWELWRAFAQRAQDTGSQTFHGRDIFAPLAIDLARGRNVEALGSRINLDDIVFLEQVRPVQRGRRVHALVVHVDHFGNSVLNLQARLLNDFLPPASPLYMQTPQSLPIHTVETYAQIPKGGVGLIPGSQGHLELACHQASCAHRLGLDIGSECIFERA